MLSYQKLALMTKSTPRASFNLESAKEWEKIKTGIRPQIIYTCENWLRIEQRCNLAQRKTDNHVFVAVFLVIKG